MAAGAKACEAANLMFAFRRGEADAPCFAIPGNWCVRVFGGMAIGAAALLMRQQVLAGCQQAHIGAALMQLELTFLDGIANAGAEFWSGGGAARSATLVQALACFNP